MNIEFLLGIRLLITDYRLLFISPIWRTIALAVFSFVMTKERESVLPDMIFYAALAILIWQVGSAIFSYIELADGAIRFPYPLEYGEGPILEQVMRLARAVSIYPSQQAIQTAPYFIANEPPLFQLLQVPFFQANGAAFWYGRALSIGSIVAAALLLALIQWTLSRNILAALISGLLLFVFPNTAIWSVFSHPDSLALALSLAGLLAVLRKPDGWAGILLGAILFTAAIFTKHSMALAGPLACVLWLVQTRRWRIGGAQSLKLILATAALSLGVFAVVNTATQGGFYFSLTTLNPNAFEPSLVLGHLINLGIHAGFVLTGCVLFVLIDRLDIQTPTWSFVVAYFVAASVAAVWTISLSAGRTGSNINDMFEWVAALCLLTGAALAWASKFYWVKIAGILLLAVQISGLGEWTQAEYQPWLTEKLNNRREIFEINKLIFEANGNVLADEFLGVLPLHGFPIPIQPMEFRQLKEAGVWSDADLIARIRRKEFSAILLYEPSRERMISVRWTPELRKAIYDTYDQHERLAETLVYRPKR